jgi:hypothetical protein
MVGKVVVATHLPVHDKVLDGEAGQGNIYYRLGPGGLIGRKRPAVENVEGMPRDEIFEGIAPDIIILMPPCYRVAICIYTKKHRKPTGFTVIGDGY